MTLNGILLKLLAAVQNEMSSKDNLKTKFDEITWTKKSEAAVDCEHKKLSTRPKLQKYTKSQPGRMTMERKRRENT